MKKILSIDVGIKNLSFCLFEAVSFKVLKWDIVDVSQRDEQKICIDLDKQNHVCGKPAKFMKGNECYCLKHSKQHNYIHATKELSMSHLKKQPLSHLTEIADKYGINYELPAKKQLVLESITQFIDAHCYSPVTKVNATKVNLVTVGRNIQHKFDEIFKEDFDSINVLIIENQIGPLANKMKTIQGMISQYFIMKNNDIQIEMVSSTNKLKEYCSKGQKLNYKQRKQLGIQVCLETIHLHFHEWESFVSQCKKKDDLSDCFLQGLWYIKTYVNK